MDHELIVYEEFAGLYKVSETTGQGLANIILDVRLRLNLPCLVYVGRLMMEPQTWQGDSQAHRQY